jgi:hypothetical protein
MQGKQPIVSTGCFFYPKCVALPLAFRAAARCRPLLIWLVLAPLHSADLNGLASPCVAGTAQGFIGYGAGWWLAPGAFVANGFQGQFVVVIPEKVCASGGVFMPCFVLVCL